mmetsp:Transcript_2/g.1  ORF Transcript_2/g.1 Transcript_2/m.1 type:complete len:295 (+) Transcript_2:1029-1913(+)
MDMLSKADMLDNLRSITVALNPLAEIIPAERGKVEVDSVFGKDGHNLVAHLNTEGQHRGAVAAALAAAKQEEDHKHGHDHQCHDHNHGYSHDHGHGDSCADPHCTDSSHGHHHHHHPGKDETSAAKRFGIHSFVYSRRTPFHPQRLKDLVLKWLPVSSNSETTPAVGNTPIKSVLRSKGFVWMSNSHGTAFYWSHAGQHFEIRDEGDWWASVDDEDWPEDPAQQQVILGDFDLQGDCGDRRQEIVFIGVKMNEEAISKQLDSALLTEDEMVKYRENWGQKPDPVHAAVQAAKKH